MHVIAQKAHGKHHFSATRNICKCIELSCGAEHFGNLAHVISEGCQWYVQQKVACLACLFEVRLNTNRTVALPLQTDGSTRGVQRDATSRSNLYL